MEACRHLRLRRPHRRQKLALDGNGQAGRRAERGVGGMDGHIVVEDGPRRHAGRAIELRKPIGAIHEFEGTTSTSKEVGDDRLADAWRVWTGGGGGRTQG